MLVLIRKKMQHKFDEKYVDHNPISPIATQAHTYHNNAAKFLNGINFSETL